MCTSHPRESMPDGWAVGREKQETGVRLAGAAADGVLCSAGRREELLTVADVAALLKVSKRWVYERARSGELRSGYAGKHLRFRYGDVLDFIEAMFR
jgi:excisionase family DNA binding protein